jgi:hypothetical protein
MHLDKFYFPSFSSLDRQCGFCPALVTPDAKSGHVHAYVSDHQKDLESYLHLTRPRHGGLCECVACIQWATEKNNAEEDEE